MTSPVSNRNPISSFIDKLLYPPSLHNPLRRSNSQKNIQEDKHKTPPQLIQTAALNKILTLSPIKHRSKSQEKSSDMFSTSKNYAEPFQGPASAMLFKISELSQTPFASHAKKEVRFKDSIIHKNQHHKRENLPRTRTPSILKKSQLLRQKALQSMQNVSSPNHIERQSSLALLSGEDRQTRAGKTNQVVKKRYFTILQRFQAKHAVKVKKGINLRSDQKYKDQLFPPITSSIFRGGAPRPQETRIQDVRWVRLPDLFKNRKITILPKGPSNLEIYCNKWRSCKNFIGNAFTCLKDCHSLLEKMFEYNQQSQFGIYMVKIFQENVWKYVIIDDYIPTYVDENGNCAPIYLNICEVQSRNNQKAIQVWPFLLEKAYANYYSNYQSLHFGNTLDFLEEITGAACQTFQFSPKVNQMKQTIKRLSSYLQRQNVVSLGYVQQQNVYIPLYRNPRKVLVAKQSYEASQHESRITMQNIFEYFDKVHIMLPTKWSFTAVSTVGINIRRPPQELPRFDISLRVLKVSEPCQISISTRQKEKRFYQSSTLNYSYIWNRIIILQKQFSGDLRWHNARYSCSKTINFTDYFEAGEYYMILMPEWKCSHCNQFSILAQATRPISITRKEYDDRQRILEKGCADLAQRFGKLQQINLHACSYCIVQEQIGFIIENINNQRFNGDIRINRSIIGIKSTVQFVPFNVEFYQPKHNKLPFRSQISVYIAADKSYTVILMTRGGIDLPLLKRFDFTK